MSAVQHSHGQDLVDIHLLDQNPIIPNVTISDAGQYCVIVTINGCDSEPACTDVEINPIPPTPNVSSNTPICSGDTIFLYTDNVAGATYLWEGPTGIFFTDEDPIITGAAAIAGEYCLIITVDGCDSEEACTDIIINPTPSAPSISSNTPLCEGNDLLLTAGLVPGATYMWSGPGFTSTDQNPTITDITVANAGTYTLFVILDGCESSSITTEVVIYPTPPQPMPASNSPICEGDDIELTVAETPGANYIWSGPNGFISFSQNPTISNATPSDDGSYCVIISLNGCDSEPGCIDVTVNPIPDTPAPTNNGPLCEGEDLELMTATVTDATYAWTGPNGYTSTDQNPTIAAATPIESGSYCVIVTVQGCESLEGCTEVVVNGTPDTPVPTNNGPLCEGEDLELMTVTVTNATYAWTGPNGYTSTDQNPIITGATPMESGSYCVIVTVAGCESLEGCTEVVVNGTPDTPIPTNNGPLCEGEDIALMTAAVTNATYAWTGPNGYTSTDQNPIITGATPTESGSYCVIVTVLGCESLEGCTEVVVNGTPETPVPSNNGPLCEGADIELMTAVVTDATYAWTGPNGYTSTDQNPIIPGASPTESGSYCVIVTVLGCESLEGCTEVEVNEIPETPVPSNNGELCEGEDLELMTAAVTDATYAWTGPNGYTSTDQNPIITGATPMESGSYCVIVTVLGCESLEGCTEVVVNGTPETPAPTNNGALCEGEDIELMTAAVTDATYAWTGPNGYTSTDQNPIITGATPMESGSYCVIVTVLGCESLEGCTEVVVNGTPETPAPTNNGALCEGEDIELMTAAVTDATYAWTGPSNGYTSTDQNPMITGATPMESGSYCVIVTVLGCESLEGCTEVVVNGTPETPVPTNNGPVCEGEDIELMTAAVTDATYAWTGPNGYTSTDQNPIITGATPMESGSYCVIVTVLGCESIEGCTEVVVNGTPETPVPTNNGPVCEGENIELMTTAVTDATYAWTGPNGYTSTDQNPIITGATPMESGSYCVIITVLGCESLEGCTEVVVNGTPETPVSTNNSAICEGEDLELMTAAVADATYAWTGPNGYTSTDQNPMITGATPMESGSYCVIVTVLGCESLEGCTEVVVNGTPETPVPTNNGPVCEGEDIELMTAAVTDATYAWTGPNGYTSSDQNPVITGATPMESGSYCVIVTVLGCESLEGCTEVVVNGTPETPVPTNNGPVCEGENIELMTTAVTDATYAWTGPNGYTSTDQNPIITGSTPMESGSYCVIVTVLGCVSLEGCTEVIVNGTPETPIPTNNSAICEGEDLELMTAAVADATYAWTGPNGYTSTDQNPVITGATPMESGSYCVVVTIQGCESLEGCTEVVVNGTPETPTPDYNGPLCEGEDLELTTPFVPNATYAWTGPNGFTSSNQNPTLAGIGTFDGGNYCVIVTVDGCESEEECVLVTVKPKPAAPIIDSNSPICQDEDLLITIDAIAGSTYAWTGPNGYTSTDQNPIIFGANPSDNGTYCVVVTVDGCESDESCINITVKPTPETPVASNNGPICEGENLEFSANTISGATYSWVGPNGFTSSDQNPIIFGANPSDNGSYCVFVTVDGCESELDCTEVIVLPTPPTPIVSNNGPICEDEDLELYADFVLGASYFWSGPNGYTSNDQNPIISGANPANSGLYCVYVVVDGCDSESACTDVTVKPTPPTPTASNNGPICEDENIELSAGSIAGATYAWTGPNGYTSNDQNPTIVSADPSDSGLYCVEITVDGCVSEADCTDVTVKPIPPTPTASNNSPICEGEDLELSTAFVAGASYTWSGPNGFTSTSQNPSIAGASPSDDGTYCVFITVDGCMSATGCTEVTIKPLPSTPIASNNGPICEDENLELYTDAVANADYAWSGPNGFTSTDQNPTINGATPSESGEYCVIVTVDGCVSESGCTEVTIKPTPQTPTASNNGPICEGEDLELATSAVPGALYSWTGPNGFTSTDQNPTIASATPAESGNYCIVITTDGCISESGCTEVIVKPTPATPIANNNGPICEGENIELSTDAVANATYAWTGPNGFTSTDQNPVISGAAPNESGSYCVVITIDDCESEAGCTNVIVKPTPATPTASNNGPICEGENIELTTSAVSGGSYSWTGPNGYTSNVQNPTIPSATPTESGNYCVVVTIDECVSESGCTEVIVKPTPSTPIANNNGPICEGENIELSTDAVVNATYTWTGPNGFMSTDQNPIISGAASNESGSYCVVITIDECESEAGCTNVVVKPTPATPTASNNGPICENENLELYTATVVGATYAWTGPNGFSSTDQNPIIASATPTDNGSYCVIVTIDECESEAGCTEVIVKPTPEDPSPSNNGPICQGENIELSTTAVAGATYSWNGPNGFTSIDQNPTISGATPSESGSYCVVITVEGCESASECTEVIVKPTPETPTANNSGVICEGGDLELSTDAVANADYTWTGPNGFMSTDQNPTITGATPSDNGSYCVIITVDGCESEPGCTEVIISPEISAGPDQSILCVVLSDLTITMDATVTTGGEWSTGANPGSVTFEDTESAITTITNIIEVGTYTFIWSNGICSDTVEVVITAQPNAGPDQTVKCDEIGSATMAAEGENGQWSWNSALEATIDIDDPNSVVTDFPSPGTYELIWTIGDCSDTVIIEVGDDCQCPIANNIIDGSPEVYCGESTARFIEGQEATPPGGTYQWQYKFNTDPFINIANTKDYTTTVLGVGTHIFRRIYSVTSPICSDTSNQVSMIVFDQPMAGADQNLECQDFNTLEVVMSGTGSGVWNQVSGPGSAIPTIVTNSDPNTVIKDFTEAGTYVFSYGEDCIDEVSITVTEAADAGPDQSIICFATSTATMSAVDHPDGVWSWGTSPDQPAFDMDNANASISGFGEPGEYVLIWTVGDCSDEVSIFVGDDCNCPIENNTIDQPDPSEFCDASPAITITGSAATPDGEYTWEYSDGGPFIAAPVPNDQQNYTTGVLPVGTHSFRRVYETTSAPICEDISNVVVITVLDQPNAGADQSISCIDLPGGSVLMNGSSIGTWSALISTNPGTATILDASLANTEINGFTAPGPYGFVYENGNCKDTVIITVTASVNAGPDQNVECYVTDDATMAAISANGTWSVGVIPATATFNPTIVSQGSPNTIVNDFDGPGTYELIWTEGDCSDIVLIVVGDDCDCPISGNDIIQPVPAEYCEMSPMILIEGADATPIDGSYTWLYSFENGAFSPAATPNDQRDYTTGVLSVGEHRFLRVFAIDEPMCEDSSDIVVINVVESPNAGVDQFLDCVELPLNVTMAGSGTGFWTTNAGNPSTSTVIVDASSATTVVENFTNPGNHFFTFDNGVCTDEVMISISEAADAGADQDVNCFLTGTASLSATGTGEWSYGTTTNNDQPTFNMSNANTTISGFAGPGTYEVIWTSNGCTDTIIITVGDDCQCPIGNNVISQPSPDKFCSESDDITIVGLDATPAGGSYVWEVSTDAGVTFNSGMAPFDQRDYNTGILGVGEYTFRRIYNLDSPDCSDTSTVVNISVLDQPDAGIDQVLECVEVPTSVTMDGAGPGTWTSNTGNPPGASIVSQNSGTTEITGLVSGDYTFTFTNGICTDEVRITITEESNAGDDQSFICYETATAVLNASGNGMWTWGSTPNGDQPAISASSPDATVSGFAFDGAYNLIWTNDDGCEDTVVINVGADCLCPIEDNIITAPNPNDFCGETSALIITGLDATPPGGTYLWEHSIDMGLWSDAPGTNDQKDYTTDLLAVGEHRYRRTYTITSPIGCEIISNIVTININENANAGPDQTVECFEDGDAIMAAIGSGTWSWSSSSTQTATIIPTNEPDAMVSDFPAAGEYILVWTTDDGCTDEVSIFVGADCLCPIENNMITQSDPNEFCGESEIVTIVGSDATPAGGTYTWEYDDNNDGVYELAPVPNDQRDYTTGVLGVGGHRFRRVYSIDSPIDCDDLSNVVLIVVYEEANAGPDQTADCFEDDVTMAASGEGAWSTTSGVTIIPLDEPNATVSGFPSAGTYELTWTTDDGCTDIVSITVGSDCLCPIENNMITQPDPNEFCGESEIVTIVGSDATPAGGTYTWEYDDNNDGIYELAPAPNDQRDYTTGLLGVGEHRFRRVYSIDSPIECDDVSSAVLILVYEEANAGPDQTADCYEDDITMAASGDGAWSTTSGVTITPLDNPNATVSGFPSAGTYELTWTTDNGCTDIVSITVGSDCLCPIENNVITQPDPNEFCGESGVVTIIGSDATPAGGTYSWEYDDNNDGIYDLAPVPNDQRDYTTVALGIGEHRFRRVYSIDSPTECDDVSSPVLIVVYEEANAGPDQAADCFEDSVTMAASGDGSWSTTSGLTITPIDNPSAIVSDFPSAGTYELTWTTDDGCTDMVSITVGADCECPIENNTITQSDPNEFCGVSEIVTIIGSDATPAGGTYTWEYDDNNDGIYDLAPVPNDQRNYTTVALGVGEHRFRRVYSIDNPMDCNDVSSAVLIIVYEEANAGPDQAADCFEDSVTMAASGDGTWSTTSGVTITPTNNPNATVSGFPSAGTYELTWTTDDGCTDIVSIAVGDECPCPIENNTIAQPDPNEFCGESGIVTILGSDATPAGGTYRWEYSFNNGGFSSATGTFDQRDYTTGALGVGEHRFRRVYSITSPMDCADVSEEVLIIVYENANAGADQIVDCFEEDTAILSASGEGTWTWSSTLVATVDDLGSADAEVSNFPQAGTYELTWTTDDGCTDSVIIEVGDDCVDCEIMENDINQPIPSDYCNVSPGMTIVGGDALPSNGTYTWEYSFNGSQFEPASGNIGQPSYNTADLGPGEHRFRRRYLLQINPICEDVSDEVVINVLGPIDAGESQNLGCIILEDAVVNMTAIGTGTWTQSSSNPSQVNITDENMPNTVVDGFASAGTYTFYWTNDMCEDEMTVIFEETKSAGEDQFVDCFVDGSAILNAEGIGVWSFGTNHPGTFQISSLNDPNATLSNFTADGTYEMIWTVDGCNDIVFIHVEENCPCVIESNLIPDNIGSTFCKTTGELLITAEEAMPMGGTYLWQMSIKGSAFSDAPGVHDTKDYDASNLGEGTYKLRRIYTLIIDGIECQDISEEIEFLVFDTKQDPGEISYTPDPVCVGDSLVLEVNFDPNLTYNWQIMSGGGRVLYALDSMSMIVVDNPGTITVSVTQSLVGCDENLVSTASEIKITVLDNPKPYLGRDTTYCELEESFTIYPGEFMEYEWQDGSTDPDFLVEEQGIYSVSVMDTMGCVGTGMVNIKSFCCEFAYPNIFRADSRGNNSEFKVTDIYDCVIESQLYIYDRWGNLVYIGDGLDTWDGTFKGKFVEQGVYVFIYKYKAMDADRQEFEDEVSGDVTVIR